MHLRNILLAIGVLALIAGASLALLWLTQRPATLATANTPPSTGEPAEPAVDRKTVKSILTAAYPIPAGTLLRPEDVTWKDMNAAEVKADTILREEGAESKFLGALTNRDFAAGEAFVTSALIKPTDRAFLAALLSPGSRAVSIPVEASQSASGLIMPDNRVDIILTQTFGESGDPARKSVGETVLKNLRVIAVDQRLGPQAPPGVVASKLDNALPKTITLEVSEREAEILTVASQLGKIEVTVRALGRAEHAPFPEKPGMPATWAGDVSPALTSLRRAPAAPAGRAAPTATTAATPTKALIEVMHGPKTETR